MKTTFITVWFLALFFCASNFAYAQKPQNYRIESTDSRTGLPSMVKVQEDVSIADFQKWIKKNFGIEDDFVFVLKNKTTDQLGYEHYRFQQFFHSTPVYGAEIIAHCQQGKVVRFNGFFLPTLQDSDIKITEEEALTIALEEVNANLYKWEIAEEEERLKKDTRNPFASYQPKAELFYVPKDRDFDLGKYRLAYRLDIYAHSPISREEIFIDVETGEVVFTNDLIHIADQVGSATTGYSGVRTITANSTNNGFTLEESGRGQGIGTYNMQNGTNYNSAVDFTDNDNNWSYGNYDKYALDAHWGAEMTYDYYLQKHGRNSIDGNGHVLLSYIHYDYNFGNAYWDGYRMTYGDGSNGNQPFTTIKIAGHEITHGLTSNSANLTYQNESGALNEAFSDIFGKSIETFARPNNTNWIMGSDLGFVMRNMSDPSQTNAPDTYQGTYWYTGTQDNGGVHKNSSVLNYWYYLLTDGGSGVNDLGNSYNVTGIGITDASKIAFRTLTVYLSPGSQYQDAYNYSVQAAQDLFGDCSPQLEATYNAWYAVGFGNGYSGAIDATFVPSTTGGCSTPLEVFFSNNSSSSSTFAWDFGDGGTSSSPNPSHTYTTAGTYTVSLIVSSSNCGADTSVMTNVITVGGLPAPTAQDVDLCSAGTADLSATANGTIEWYDASVGGNLVGTGSSFTTPVINSSTTYYVQQSMGGTGLRVGAVDNTIGNGGYFNGDQYLIFDCYTACTLNSVWVDANGSGNRTIELRDNTGAVLQSATINIPNGQSRINLNFSIPVGQDLQLGWAAGSQPNLYRNSDGPTYPYTLDGILSIKNSSASVAGYYYAFYDWDITAPYCASPRTAVNVNVMQAPTATGASRCGAGTLTLLATAVGTGTLNWYDAPTGGNLVGTGGTFTTPPLSSTTNYYVEEANVMPTITGGPVDNTFFQGGYFNGDQHLIFDCFTPTLLKSVKVYAGSTGNRTIELRDNTGAVLQSAVVNIPAGESRVTLNFNIPVGTNLQLGTASNSSQDLFRNQGGASFPYNIGSLITITETSAAALGAPNYYYYFYDWWVEEVACSSGRTQVTATIDGSVDPTISPVNNVCISDSPITLTAATGGGTWSGTGVNAQGVFDPSIGAGTYTITYSITGSCTATDQIDITVDTPKDATITSGTTYCLAQGNIQLTAVDQGGVWSGNGIIDTINGIFSTNMAGVGLHTITYSIPGGCGDTQSVSIYVSATGNANFTVLNSNVCESEAPFTLVPITNGGVWSGTGVDSQGVFDPATAGVGSHVITYTLTGGCSDTHSETIVVEAQANAAINYVGAICSDHSPITVTAATPGGIWSGDGITDSQAGTFDPSVAGVGSHDITYFIAGNCGATATTTIDVENCTGIDELGESTLQVFPNPARNKVSVVLSNVKSVRTEKLYIYNQLGELVLSRNITPVANRFNETIDISFLARGVYTLRIGSLNKKITKI